MPIAPDNLDLRVPIGADSSRYIGFRSAAIGTYRDLSGAIGTKNEFPSNPNQIGKKMVRLSISGSSRRKESHFCISRINYSSPTTGYGLIRNLKSKSKNLKIPSKRTRQNLKQLPSLALVKAGIFYARISMHHKSARPSRKKLLPTLNRSANLGR